MKKDLFSDQALGMDRPITRRDFLNGIAIGTAALAAGPLLADVPGSHPVPPGTASATQASTAAQDAPGLLPAAAHRHARQPSRLLRGRPCAARRQALARRPRHRRAIRSHRGRRGHQRVSPPPTSIASTPAATSRILILDNHDDFGGHAKRNEFNLDGHLNLLNGGTLGDRQSAALRPGRGRPPDDARHRRRKAHQNHAAPNFYEQHGSASGRVLRSRNLRYRQAGCRHGRLPLRQVLARQAVLQAPLSDRARKEIVQIETRKIDYLPGLSSDEKKQRLSRMSYEAFLRDVVHVGSGGAPVLSRDAPWANGASAPMPCPRSIAGGSACPDFKA